VYNHLLRWTQTATRRKPIEDRIRSALDPGIRKQRREVRKWRRWHEVFRVLNEIEQRLGEIVSLLVQAAASMSQFGECHNRLSDCAKLSAFLRDAALYFQSESDIPKRLESHLECLERVADEFRTISVEAAELEASREQQSELWKECEDLQVDIAVLLESTQMTAQHALAEYKKMHCRLELLVTEYEPICRLELEVARPAFLPLLTDDSAKQVSAASVPERAVQWALDFATLVGSSSHGLGELVRDLNHRARQVSACSQELRDYTLRFAASAQPDIS
jgi:DNA repair exonuclease SbcCD ATPase subunit